MHLILFFHVGSFKLRLFRFAYKRTFPYLLMIWLIIDWLLPPSPLSGHSLRKAALLQIVGGDKLIIPFADGAAHEPIQRPAFSA